jgi:hypothetical protein
MISAPHRKMVIHACLRIIYQLARQLLNNLENSFFSSTSPEREDLASYFSSSQTILSPPKII